MHALYCATTTYIYVLYTYYYNKCLTKLYTYLVVSRSFFQGSQHPSYSFDPLRSCCCYRWYLCGKISHIAMQSQYPRTRLKLYYRLVGLGRSRPLWLQYKGNKQQKQRCSIQRKQAHWAEPGGGVDRYWYYRDDIFFRHQSTCCCWSTGEEHDDCRQGRKQLLLRTCCLLDPCCFGCLHACYLTCLPSSVPPFFLFTGVLDFSYKLVARSIGRRRRGESEQGPCFLSYTSMYLALFLSFPLVTWLLFKHLAVKKAINSISFQRRRQLKCATIFKEE